MDIIDRIVFGFIFLGASVSGFAALYLGIEYHFGTGHGLNAVIAAPMVLFSIFAISRSMAELYESL